MVWNVFATAVLQTLALVEMWLGLDSISNFECFFFCGHGSEMHRNAFFLAKKIRRQRIPWISAEIWFWHPLRELVNSRLKTVTLSPIIMEVENYPQWKETNIGDSPIFHWTMIVGGRALALAFAYRKEFLWPPKTSQRKTMNCSFQLSFFIGL